MDPPEPERPPQPEPQPQPENWPNRPDIERGYIHKFRDIQGPNDFMYYDHRFDAYYFPNSIGLKNIDYGIGLTTIWHASQSCCDKYRRVIKLRRKDNNNLNEPTRRNPDFLVNINQFNIDNYETYVVLPTQPCFIFEFDEASQLFNMLFPCPYCVLKNPRIYFFIASPIDFDFIYETYFVIGPINRHNDTDPDNDGPPATTGMNTLVNSFGALNLARRRK